MHELEGTPISLPNRILPPIPRECDGEKREDMKKIRGKLIDISYSQPDRIDYSPYVVLIPPWTRWSSWIDFLGREKRARLRGHEPLPITWPPGKTFQEAFLPDNPEPYKGPPRTGIIGLMGDPNYIFLPKGKFETKKRNDPETT